MGFSQDHDLINRTKQAYGADNVAVTAGGANDAALQTGVTLDRFALGLPLVGLATLRFKATLAAAATLTLTVLIEHSDDGATFYTFQQTAPQVVATGAVGGSTVRDVYRVNVDLAGAKQFVRVKFTPDLSSANTDTAEISAVWDLAGLRTGVPV